MTTRLTLLAGGGTVYLYPDATDDAALRERIAAQRAILDVAYPADETMVSTIDAARWPDIEPKLRSEGLDVVDVRGDAADTAPEA